MRGSEFFVEISKRAPFTKLHPRLADFFKDYFAHEKAVRFGERTVVNTHFPPYPSRAFDNLAESFSRIGDADHRRLYSVALAVTNRCTFNCWHCYNVGRNQQDLPLDSLQETAAQLQSMGAVMVTLTGGEPLLRDDLEDIAGLFDDRTCLIVGTTGAGLTAERARRLRDRGVFGIGVSLDSSDEDEHDHLRGSTGAFRTALDALHVARQNDLYPYIVAVATREFLAAQRFMSFMRFAGDAGALEVHVLEPSATGKLAGDNSVSLSSAERRLIFDYQEEVARDDDLPILSSYAYLESAEAFGCGAALTHLYIDGSGEVCPCQFAPLSFGNVAREPLAEILERMGHHFRMPRTGCVGRLLAREIPDGQLLTVPDESRRLCGECLPDSHAIPRFFKIHSASRDEIGVRELQAAYDRVHGDYDTFWLSEAAKPIAELVGKMRLRGVERLFEAGCGTGYATALLAKVTRSVVAVDLSEGMLAEARKRIHAEGHDNVHFICGDALDALNSARPLDVIFSSWVLGYIPLRPFFTAAARALSAGGRLAFIVHKENSPRQGLEIFAELVARDPTVLQKRVAFDFPRDAESTTAKLVAEGFAVEQAWEGAAVFRYERPQEVLDHLLKSGAGTAFYDAIDPQRREVLAAEFVELLSDRHRGSSAYQVAHEYVATIAQLP